MKIGISNIAFNGHSFVEALEYVKSLPVEGLEIAPTLIWENPCASSKRERRAIRELISEYDIAVIGLQSLLYGRPDLQVFDSLENRKRCTEYLKRMIELCADLRGTVLAFGAPQNRKRGLLLSDDAANVIAVAFFYEMAVAARDMGVCFCIEPLSSQYGCDFITTAAEGAQLVESVNLPNFRLLLDTGSMSVNGELCLETIREYADEIFHLHINDPHLAPPGATGVDHLAVAETLREIGYKSWLTLEFLANTSCLEKDISYALRCYGHSDGKDSTETSKLQ